MKLSFNSWLPSYTLDETIKRPAATGYDAIEIGAAGQHAWYRNETLSTT